MKSTLHAALPATMLGLLVPALTLITLTLTTLTLSASAREMVLPAGTLLQCTMNEPNFSSATADVGDPVLCHLRGVTEFGQQAFPRGTYLVGHLEAAKDPGHFWGKGYLKLQFDRIGLPNGDLPLDAKLIGTRGYKVDKEGKIDGKGHAVRDVVEWMIPPLWPWKVIMLPARGPRPTLKGETVLSLRLMDDVQIPQLAQTIGPSWHFFGRYQNGSYHEPQPSNSQFQFSVTQTSLAGHGLANNGVTNGAASNVLNDNVLNNNVLNNDVLNNNDQVIQPAQPVAQASYATYVSRDVPTPTLANVVSLPGMPVFVLNTGAILSVSGYGYQADRITYSLVGGGSGVISTNDVDWNSTTQLNAQRGIRVTLHNAHANAGTAGF
jgi:hypothetical protein